MRYIPVATVLFLACAVPAISQELTSADLPQMQDAYRQNGARFKQEFVGRQFAGQMPLQEVVEDHTRNGVFHLKFGSAEALSPEVLCATSDKATIAEAAKWNRGDMIELSGMVDDHMAGMTFLRKCAGKRV